MDQDKKDHQHFAEKSGRAGASASSLIAGAVLGAIVGAVVVSLVMGVIGLTMFYSDHAYGLLAVVVVAIYVVPLGALIGLIMGLIKVSAAASAQESKGALEQAAATESASFSATGLSKGWVIGIVCLLVLLSIPFFAKIRHDREVEQQIELYQQKQALLDSALQWLWEGKENELQEFFAHDASLSAKEVFCEAQQSLQDAKPDDKRFDAIVQGIQTLERAKSLPDSHVTDEQIHQIWQIPLRDYVEKGNWQKVDQLLEAGGSLNSSLQTTGCQSDYSQVDVTELAWLRGETREPGQGEVALLKAVERGAPVTGTINPLSHCMTKASMKKLLAYGAQVNRRNEFRDETPLSYLLHWPLVELHPVWSPSEENWQIYMKKQLQCAQDLLDLGADPDVKGGEYGEENIRLDVDKGLREAQAGMTEESLSDHESYQQQEVFYGKAQALLKQYPHKP